MTMLNYILRTTVGCDRNNDRLDSSYLVNRTLAVKNSEIDTEMRLRLSKVGVSIGRYTSST